jgi:hypothetical protein
MKWLEKHGDRAEGAESEPEAAQAQKADAE